MKITAQQFVSNGKEDGTFVTIFKHFSNSGEKNSSREGDLYCILSISSEKNIPTERVSKFVWDGILDGYIYSTQKSTNNALKEGIEEGVQKLRDLIKNEKTLEELGVNVNFVLVAHKKEGLYVGSLGENDIYVYKEGKIVDISDVLKKGRANTAGIALGEKDLLMVATKNFLQQQLESLVKLRGSEEVVGMIANLGENIADSNALLFFSDDELRVSTTAEEMVDSHEQEILPHKESTRYTIMAEHTIKYTKGRFAQGVRLIKEGFVIYFAKFKEWIKKIFGNKKWFKKAVSKISEIKINTGTVKTMKGMKIDGYKVRDTRSRRIRIVVIGVAIIVLLALGINFTIKARNASIVHKQATEIFTNVENLIKKAENYLTSDKSTAEVSIYQAKNLLDGITSELSEKDSEIRAGYEKKILDIEDSMYYRVGLADNDGKLSTFLDSRLAFGEGSNPSDIEIYTDGSGNRYLLITDKGLKSVYRVSLYDKSTEKLLDTGNLVKEPLYASMGNTGLFVFDEKAGVLKAPFDSSKWFSTFVAISGLSRESIKPDKISEFIVLTESDNIYMLAQDESALLKSTFSYENRYGLYYKYITDDKFVNASDILADLSVYFLSSDSPYLIRYSYNYMEQTQKENPLTISGVDGELGILTKGYTTESLDDGLYVFDSTNRRFIRFEKPQEGGTNIVHPNEVVLKEQFVYRGSKGGVWDNVKDLVVDISTGDMYILDGSTVWKIVI